MMLHNIGANIQAKEMTHFLTALPLQRWRGSPSVACMYETNFPHCVSLYTVVYLNEYVCL